jgi:rhamnosyltransferase subunit B
VLYGAILENAPRLCELIAEHHQPGSTVLAAPSINVGARLAQDRLGIPLASIILNPILMRSIYSPGRSPLLQVPSWTGRWGVKLAYQMIDRKYEQMIGVPLNRIRCSMELPPVRGIAAWMRSPQQIICLWPEWLYGRQPDWPAHADTTTFVSYDGASTLTGNGGTARETEGWSLREEDAPIVFTLGTAMSQGRRFFAAAAEACAISRRPGLLLTQRPEQLPESLPEGVEHLFYAPFGELLPKAAAIVHHGGIGTSARALEAGIPQLMVPLAYDQFDNSSRFAAIGVATELPIEELNAETLAGALDRLLGSSIIAERCRTLAGMARSSRGLDHTCELLEALEAADIPDRAASVSTP